MNRQQLLVLMQILKSQGKDAALKTLDMFGEDELASQAKKTIMSNGSLDDLYNKDVESGKDFIRNISSGMPQEVVDAEVNLYAEERSNELAASKNKPQSLSFVEEKEPEDLPVIAPNPNSKASNLSQYVDIVGSVNPKLVPQAAEIAKTAGISVQQPVQPEQQQVQAPVQPSVPAQQETQAPVQPQTKSNGYVDLASRFGANPIQQPMDLMEESVKKISAENKLPPPSLNFLRIKDTRTGQEYVTNNKGEFTEIFNYEDVAKEKGVYDPIVGVMSLLSPEGGTVRQKRTKEDLQEGLRAGKYQIVTNDNGKPAYSNPNDFYYQAPDGFTFDPATKRVRGYDKDTNEYIDKILSDSEIEEFVNKYNTKLTKVSKTKSAQLDEDGNLKASSDWSVSAELPMPVTFSWAAEQELDRAKQSLFSQGFDWIKEKIGASEMLRDEQGRPVYKGYDPNRHKDQELKFTTEKKKFLANIPPANTKYYNTQGEVFVIKDGGNADVFDDKGNKLAEINAVTMAELYASNKLSKGKELFNEKQIEDQKTSYAESLKQKMLQVDKATIKKENDMVKIITKDGVSTFTNDEFNNYRRPVKMSDGTVQNMTPKEFYEYYNDAKQYERDAIQAEIDGLDDWTVTSLIKQALPGFTQGAVGATKTLLNVPTYIHNVFSQTFGNKNYVTDDRYKMVYDPETGTYTNLDKKLIDKRVKAISHLEEFQKKREALNITSPENKNAKIIGNAIGQLGSQALVGAVGGWTASMAYMGAQGFNDNYQQALQMQTEKNPFMATLYAGTASAVEIASEYYLSPLRKLAKATTKLDDFTYAMKRATFDKVSKVMPSVENKFLGEAGKYMLNETGELVLDKNLARRIVRNGIDLTQDVLEESVSEGLAAFGNNAAYNLMVSNTKDLTEGILDSMIGGGGAGAFANILRKSVSKLNKNNDAYSPALQEQFEENLKKAETNATNIERHINNTPDQFFFKFNVDRGNGKSEPVYMYKNQDDPASKPMVIDEATYKAGTIAFIPRAYRANDVEGAKAHLQQINELTGSQMKWEDVTASGNEASVKDFYKFLNKQRSQSSTLLEQNPDKQLEAYKLATNKNPDQSDERTEEEIRTAAANMKLALFPDLFSTPRAAYKSSFPTGSFTQAELDQDGNVVEGITTPYQVAYVGQDSNGVRVFELTDMDGNKIDVGQSVLEGMVPAGETGTLFSELFSLSVQPNPNLNPNVPSSIDVQPAPSNVAIKPDFAEVSIENKKDAEDAITGNRLEGSQKTIAEAIAGEKGIKFTDTKGKEHTGKPENLKSNSDGSVTFKIGNKNYQLGKVENVELMPEEEVKPVETPKEEAPKAEKEKATEMSKEETTEAPKEEAPTDVENKEGTTEVPKEETPKEEKKETPETKEGVYVLTDKKSFDTAIDALVAANILTEQEGDLVKRMNTAYAALYKAITGTENYYTTLGSIKVVDKIDEEGTIRGQYNKIDNIPSITIAKNAGIKPDLSTVVHEIAHANRQIFFGILYTKEYFIPLRLRSKLELLKKSIEKKCGVLDGKWTVENEEAYAELIEKLMTDPTFINRMIPSERTLYTFLRDSIKYVFNKLRSIVLKPSDIYTQLTDVYSADFLDDISDFKRYNDLERLNYLLNVYPSSKLTKYFPNMEVEIVDGIRVLKNRQVFEDMRTELINKTIERQQAEMQKEIEQAGDASLNQTGDVTLNQQTKVLENNQNNDYIIHNMTNFIYRMLKTFKTNTLQSMNLTDKIEYVWSSVVLMSVFKKDKYIKLLSNYPLIDEIYNMYNEYVEDGRSFMFYRDLAQNSDYVNTIVDMSKNIEGEFYKDYFMISGNKVIKKIATLLVGQSYSNKYNYSYFYENGKVNTMTGIPRYVLSFLQNLSESELDQFFKEYPNEYENITRVFLNTNVLFSDMDMSTEDMMNEVKKIKAKQIKYEYKYNKNTEQNKWQERNLIQQLYDSMPESLKKQIKTEYNLTPIEYIFEQLPIDPVLIEDKKFYMKRSDLLVSFLASFNFMTNSSPREVFDEFRVKQDPTLEDLNEVIDAMNEFFVPFYSVENPLEPDFEALLNTGMVSGETLSEAIANSEAGQDEVNSVIDGINQGIELLDFQYIYPIDENGEIITNYFPHASYLADNILLYNIKNKKNDLGIDDIVYDDISRDIIHEMEVYEDSDLSKENKDRYKKSKKIFDDIMYVYLQDKSLFMNLIGKYPKLYDLFLEYFETIKDRYSYVEFFAYYVDGVYLNVLKEIQKNEGDILREAKQSYQSGLSNQSSGDVTLNQQTKPKQKPSPEFQSKVIQRLKSIFPNVQIADVNDFYSKGRELGFTNQQLERANAFITPERIIYISPDNVNETTALHEFSHVFIEQMKKENPEMYTEIARQIVKTGYMQWADSTYPELPVESRMEEAIAEAIATEARGMLTESGDLKQRTAIAKLKKLIKDFWNAVAKAMNIKKNPRYMSIDQLVNESAEQMVYKPDVNFDEFVSRMIQAGNLIAVCT